MPTYSISETETFDRTSVISDAHFGVNFVSHSDFEFLAGSQQAETLASLGATNFRFPGGGITEGDFADASFLTGNWAADSHGTRTLTPMSDFFATAGEVNADVQFVIPTRVAFATSSGQSLWNLHQGNSGEHYGARTAIDPNYFTLLTNYIEEALSLASHNGVEISTFEIGNEFWLGGEMSASEYGYLAGEIAAWLNDNYPGVDILVQATNTVGVFSPFNNETVYLEAITGEGGETDYTVHTSEPDGVAVTSVTVPAQGNWAAQTRDLAQAIANNPDGVTAIDGVLFHNYFDDGFAGIDTEDEQKLEQVYDRFASFTGRSDLEFHITEWSPDTNNDSGLQNAQSYIEGFFELVQWGVDGADAWPLTYANPETRNRNLIDTGDAQSHLTFAGVAFQWLSESTEGLEAKFDYEVTGQIDVHGFGNANRLVAFVGERSGTAQANTIVDFNNFALNGDYFVVVSSMGDSGAGGISNSAAPDLVFSDGVVASGDTVALDLEGWDLARIEMTAVTDNADKLIGRDGNDTITAEGGNDKVYGNGGNDSLKGQLGNDTLKGDDGNDTLKAGHGNDKLYGGFGDDFLDGGEGNDYLRDDSGADQFIGGGGSDTASYWGWHSGRADNSETLEVNLLTGVNNSGDTYSSIENLLGSNNQRDKFVGTNGTNELDGAGGHDTLHGLGGDDSLIGREGDDRLYGGSGNDTLDGGDGDDYLRDEGGLDHYIGGSGSDTASYWGWYASQAENSKTLTVNLSTGVNNSGDTYNSIENLLGSDKQKNHLTGTNGVNDLEGGVGEDSLYGLGGNDTLRGDAGKDQLFGGAGNDKLYGGSGSDTLEGGEGNDYLRDDSGADQFIGGGGLDTASYWGWYASQTENSRTLEVNLLTGVNNSGDTYSSIENLLGSNNQRDKFVGTNGTNELDGAGGHDTLHGLDGDDNLIGREGDDRLYGGSGNDTLDGGDGDDYLRDEAGLDHFIGGNGSDTVSYWGRFANEAENTKTLTVNLSTGVNSSGDTYDSIENLLGSTNQKDHFTGTNGANELDGAGGNDSLYGLGGNDSLIGGAGNDLLVGGSGSDTFVFKGNFGQDILTDFSTTQAGERIDLSGVSSITSFSDLSNSHLTQSGGNTIIDAGAGNTITLNGVTLSSLVADDFIF